MTVIDKQTKIKVIGLDVDGTITDGKLYHHEDGIEVKTTNVKDGMGINKCLQAGLTIVLISGRKSPAIYDRFAKLGVEEMYLGVHNKVEILERILTEKGLTRENLAFMGDDINDLKAMEYASLSAAPADAVEEVLAKVDFKSRFTGGHGAVREFVEGILRAQNLWETSSNKPYRQ